MSTVKDIVREYWAHRAMELAAALLLLHPPLARAPGVDDGRPTLLFERGAVEATIVTEIQALIGDSGAEVVHTILRSAHDQETGVLSVAIGALVLLVGATTVFVQLQDAPNRIESRPAAPCRALRWRTGCERRISAVAAVPDLAEATRRPQ